MSFLKELGQRSRHRLLQPPYFNRQRRLLTGKRQVPEKASYIDEWFSAIVKPESFYEGHADANPRRYFYNVDLQGRLFLEETLPKNIATSIKDDRFLDFFFRMVRPVGPREQDIMVSCNISNDEYPYVSPCGKELNFIRPAATPIVFHTLNPGEKTLSYAGSKSQAFQVSDLALSEHTGRLYHRCDHMDKAVRILQKDSATADIGSSHEQQQYALIRSAVVVSLSDRIVPLPDDFISREGSLSGLAFSDNDVDFHPIPWLPREVESGKWTMPSLEGIPED